MKIDIHVHTIFSYYPRRSDAIITPRDLIPIGKQNGLDGLVVTDHMVREAGAREIKELNEQHPDFLLLHGSEYHSDKGHLLLYGPTDDSVVRRFGKYGPAQEVIDFVNDLNGAVVVAHPFMRGYTHATGDRVFSLKGVVALEEINGTKSAAINRKASKACRKLGLPGIGGSDAHVSFDIGRAYTDFERDIRSMADLVRELREGKYVAQKNNAHVRNYLSIR